VALTNHFIKNWPFNLKSGSKFSRQLQSDIVGAASRASSKYQSQRGNVRIGLPMIKHPMDGLLFFDGRLEMPIVAYDVSRTSAVVHSDGLDLLPIDFYVTFDDFLTVGKCRLLEV
jgi:hypothetical protein